MKDHEYILEQLASRRFPDSIDESDVKLFPIFRALVDQDYIAAQCVNTNSGECYFEPRITLEGRQFLETLKAPPKSVPHSISIGSVSGSNFQVGSGNSLSVNISMQELTEKVAAGDDDEAKSKLKAFLNNSTVAGLIGAGATALLALL